MRLIAHHELQGFGGIGEGMALQATRDGRRILWLAHESAPKNFTGVDVTDPRQSRVVVQTELPHAKVRSNSLDVVGDVMAVAYQTQITGLTPAGFDLFDVGVPEQPKLIAHFDASGSHSRGVHALWFVDGEFVHMASGAADFQPRHPFDDQFYRIVDVRNPSRPAEVGRWWLPGTREGDEGPPPRRLDPKFDAGFRAHNTNVYPQRPDRAYVGYIDGGALVLDIADKAHPKLVWMLDARMESNPVPISTLPPAPHATFARRGGRFGAHNLHENLPVPTSWSSDQIVIGTFFNAGVRAYDIGDPFQPREVAYFVPGAPARSPAGSIQLNDVYVDERRIVYTVDRYAGGLYILEMTL
ncbi:MAG: hypothetical protein E6H53_10750 [Betaproteobacteria bacterium]|nr:MAG: hypothetical protein E6H53_10750 [Betaproteobacteria bacterium]